jgi:hypothetical protein
MAHQDHGEAGRVQQAGEGSARALWKVIGIVGPPAGLLSSVATFVAQVGLLLPSLFIFAVGLIVLTVTGVILVRMKSEITLRLYVIFLAVLVFLVLGAAAGFGFNNLHLLGSRGSANAKSKDAGPAVPLETPTPPTASASNPAGTGPSSTAGPTGSAHDPCVAMKPSGAEPKRLQSCTWLGLRVGTSADFDQAGADWGTPGGKGQPGEDIYANHSYNLEVQPNRLSLAVIGQVPSYAACNSPTNNWNDEVISPKAGSVVCARTDLGRLALVFIRDVPQSATGKFDIEIIVWDK